MPFQDVLWNCYRYIKVSRSRSALFLLCLICALYLLSWKPFGPSSFDLADSSTRKELQALHFSLKSHFEEHGQELPTPVFPLHPLTRGQMKRYQHLATSQDRFMFVTITRQIQDSLPDLLTALLLVTHFLGPSKVSFSFVEGPSSDLTPSILNSVLQPALLRLGVPSRNIHIITDADKVDFTNNNRIVMLAELRNRATSPLWNDPDGLGKDVKAFVFFNDVFLKGEHFLEVLHQHVLGGAGITTAWDWWKREPPYFYDIWVARTIDTGDLFYPIETDFWTPSTDLLSTSPSSLAAYNNLQPFQVFCSWNGMAVFDPAPFLPPYNIRFRRGDKKRHECAQAECSQACSDYWKLGFGKVQVVPSVQVAYERDTALQTEEMMQAQRISLGWRDGVPVKAHKRVDVITKWIQEPPAKVRCHRWPEINGLQANIWEKTEWTPPWLPDEDEDY